MNYVGYADLTYKYRCQIQSLTYESCSEDKCGNVNLGNQICICICIWYVFVDGNWSQRNG